VNLSDLGCHMTTGPKNMEAATGIKKSHITSKR